jgi:hypothetical protein
MIHIKHIQVISHSLDMILETIFWRISFIKSGSLRFSQFSGCWLILSVYILMSFDFPFVRLFGVRCRWLSMRDYLYMFYMYHVCLCFHEFKTGVFSCSGCCIALFVFSLYYISTCLVDRRCILRRSVFISSTPSSMKY